jgi:hypothetical protein
MSQATIDPTVTSEWLFRAEGQIFGPVPESKLVELLLEGRLDATSEVAPEGGAWRRLGEVPRFVVHVKKAEARARVEAEVTGARRLKRRRTALQGALAACAVAAVVALVGAGAWWLAVHRPWEKRSALLESFGDGIAIGEVSVGSGRAAADDELELPQATSGAPAAARPERRRTPAEARPGAAPRPRTSGDAEGGDLLAAAQYDPRRIQAVVSRRQGSLAPCLRDEAQRSPEFRGAIPVEFAVGNDGRVSALWIDEPRFKSGPLRDCLLARLKEWEFDRFPGQRPVVSLSFRIGD